MHPKIASAVEVLCDDVLYAVKNKGWTVKYAIGTVCNWDRVKMSVIGKALSQRRVKGARASKPGQQVFTFMKEVK
jgi:hypothetical protein